MQRELTKDQKIHLLSHALEHYADISNWSDIHRGERPSFKTIKDDLDRRYKHYVGGRKARDILMLTGLYSEELRAKNDNHWND